MIDTHPRSGLVAIGPSKPLISFAALAALLMVVVCVVAGAVFGNVWVPAATFTAITGLGLYGLRVSYPHGVLGFCNAVTLTRAALVALLTGAIVAQGLSGWFVFSVACLAFALDGLDGMLARRSGLSSTFGARFDMEIDAVLAAVLALILLTAGTAGIEVLMLGFMRYAFVIATLAVPRLRAELPESFRRKNVCVVQIATLIFLLCPLTPEGLRFPAAIGAAALLSWSFAIDILALLKARP